MAKYTGVIRSLDALGRIVVPKEIRKTLNIEAKDNFEFYINGETQQLILQKVTSRCLKCNATEDLCEITNGFHLCKRCYRDIN